MTALRDSDPETFRRSAEAFVNLLLDVLEAETRDPILPKSEGHDLERLFDEAPPFAGTPLERLIEQLRSDLLPACRRNGHPRFFAYVCASADPLGAFLDALTSLLNQNVTAWRSAPGADIIERRTIAWLADILGFGRDAQGIFVSGGSAANALALSCALGRTLADRSMASHQRERLTLYLTSETHLSVRKAAIQLGFVADHVRIVDKDTRRCMSPQDLERRLRLDRSRGLIPFCVVASAGTANCGTVDPLSEIAEVARAAGSWFHVDGAYGAPAAMTRTHSEMREPFGKADSLAIDPHKWLFSPLDVGCLLVRSFDGFRSVFSTPGDYVTVHQTDLIEKHAFFDEGFEMSRRFRALKVWALLKLRGVDELACQVERNIELRRFLDRKVVRHSDLEPLSSGLSISCFRYRPSGWAQDDNGSPQDGLNRLNQSILERLNSEGRLCMSPTTLEGRYALRACIVNFRTRKSDIDFLVEEVVRVGRLLDAQDNR